MYMNKIAVGPEAVGKIDINASVTDNLKAIAQAKNKEVEDIVAVVLDRPRHTDLIKELREAGARIKLIPDGDVAGAINTAFDETGVDVLFGIGVGTEGVLTDCDRIYVCGEFVG